MKKLFLVPLMAMLCTVMAWSATRTAGTFAKLQEEIEAAAAGDVIELTADIAYPTNGTGLINITKSITLDGKGHKLSGYGTANISVSATQNWPVTLAVNYGGSASAALDVTIQNLHVSNKAAGTRSYGLMAWDGVDKLTLKNDSIYLGKSTASYKQVICFTGTDATPINLKIEDSFIGTATGSGYPAYILKPIKGTFKNTEFSGYCALYFKYRATGAYGTVVGSRGSVIDADNCNFDAPNIHSGYSNDFAVFAFEDDGITLNLNNCGMNAEVLGNADQTMVSASEWGTRREQNININISGDNSYINGDFVSNDWNFKWGEGVHGDDEVYSNGYWRYYDSKKKAYTKEGYDPALAFTPYTGRVNVTITGGTYAINPDTYRFVGHVISAEDLSEFEQRRCTIPGEYEVKEITTQQGDKVTTLYRVREKITTPTSTSINDNVESKGDGQNDNTNFNIATNQTVEEESVIANYIEVSDNATLTVPTGKELAVTNGLDVTDGAKVVIEAGSTVKVGEGGITSEATESIVVEADENGSASLLLDPEVIVNTTPNLTVKMVAKQTGKIASVSGYDEYWHRFAMPVAHVDTWQKEGSLVGTTYPTYLYGWDYVNDKWAKLAGGVSDMVPFKGYTLRLATEEIAGVETLQDVTYIFKGNLAGNTNSALDFTRDGYNFFGNSYTGYISIAALASQITGDEKLEGTVWTWNTTYQRYEAVALEYVGSEEIAPMHTFIMRMNVAGTHSTELNYKSAIWDNPRYGNASPAPARAKAADLTSMRVVITAADGKSDVVRFYEDANRSDAFDNGYDASKYMNERTINAYSTNEGKDLSIVSTNNLEGKTISLNTNDELAYTLSFTNVLNFEAYALEDMVTGKVIAIEEGTTYEFAAQPNSTAANRFRIVSAHKVPTSVETTEAQNVVKGIYTILGQYVGEDFNALPAGVYVVDGVKIVK